MMDLDKVERYLRQLPPHVASREGAILLRDAKDEIVMLRGVLKAGLLDRKAREALKDSEMTTDTEILDWLESQYGLHREVEITYVVDGYTVEFTYDGNPTDGNKYHGENLREALRKAMSQMQT